MPRMAKRFKREKKLYHLNFENIPELRGFECICTGTTLQRFVEFAALSEQTRNEENVKRQFELFAECLVSWNLDDENDEAVPCTYEGLASQELDFIQAIMGAWMREIASVNAPLAEGSSSGEISQEELSLELAKLSESHAS